MTKKQTKQKTEYNIRFDIVYDGHDIGGETDIEEGYECFVEANTYEQALDKLSRRIDKDHRNNDTGMSIGYCSPELIGFRKAHPTRIWGNRNRRIKIIK